MGKYIGFRIRYSTGNKEIKRRYYIEENLNKYVEGPFHERLKICCSSLRKLPKEKRPNVKELSDIIEKVVFGELAFKKGTKSSKIVRDMIIHL